MLRSSRALAVAVSLLVGCGGQPAKVEPSETPMKGGAQPAAQPGNASAQAEPADATTPEEARAHIEEGQSAAAGGDLSSAQAAFEQAIQVAPGLPEAHYNLGVLAEWQGRYDEARGHYERALEARADYAPAVVAVANLLIRKGDRAGARSFAQQQLGRTPDNLELRNALNRVRLQFEGNAPEVITDTKRILRKDEKNVLAMVNLAAAYAQQGKHELAIAILDNARALDEANPEILARKALAHAALDEELKARMALEEAAQLPGGATAEVYNNLGLIYHEAGDFVGAEAQFRKALTRWPDMIEARINLGNALKGQQRFADAAAELNKALTQAPEMAEVHYNLGILYLDGTLPDIEPVQRLEQALRFFERYKREAGTLAPDDPVEQYVAETQKRIEVEKKRAEQMKRMQQAKPAPSEVDGAEDAGGTAGEGDDADGEGVAPETDAEAAPDDAAASAEEEAPADASETPVEETGEIEDEK